MTSQTATTFRIKVHAPERDDFDQVVRVLKKAGATFDADTKTWTITATDGRDGLAEIVANAGVFAKWIARRAALFLTITEA